MAIHQNSQGQWVTQTPTGNEVPVKFETLQSGWELLPPQVPQPPSKLGALAEAVGNFGEQAFGDLGIKH